MTTQRIQRFQIGDTVEVVRGGAEPARGRVWEVVCDPTDVKGYEHCSGNSAKYHVVGTDEWVYDWQLELFHAHD